jgi:hypothetical protein
MRRVAARDGQNAAPPCSLVQDLYTIVSNIDAVHGRNTMFDNEVQQIGRAERILTTFAMDFPWLFNHVLLELYVHLWIRVHRISLVKLF